MPIIFGKAPGKIILLGEHAVVYGQPALAVPVTKVNATARVIPDIGGKPGRVHLQASDIDLEADLSNLLPDHPLALAVSRTLEILSPNHIPPITLQISSTIPISAGMGSSAAVTIAVIRALSSFFGLPMRPAEISDLAYEVEKVHHGTPSGIDNNVIAHQKPVFFKQDQPLEYLLIKSPTHWIIADTGEKTPTRETVSAVRALHSTDRDLYGSLFNQIGDIVEKARSALIHGDTSALGWLMNENQRLLEKLNVNSPSLDHLIKAAREAGAFGAKLSGGGRGGNMIALIDPKETKRIAQALMDAGAYRTITTPLIPGDK